MAKYTREEITAYLEECKKRGITDPGCLYQIQTAMRIGYPESVLNAVSIPELSELQMVKLFGLSVNGFPEAEVLRLAREPRKLSNCLGNYYGNLYDRKKVYQEVFNDFQKSWQKNFDQLSKQTEVLADSLRFMQEQLEKKEQELKTAVFEKREQIQEPEQLQEEKESRQSNEAQMDVPPQKRKHFFSPLPPIPKQTCSLFSSFGKKKRERALIGMIARLEEDQFEQALDGYEKGLTLEEVGQYAVPEMTSGQMEKAKQFLLKMKQQEEK